MATKSTKSTAKTAKSVKKKSTGRRAIGRPPASASGVGKQALIEKTCELLRTLPPDLVTRAEVARHAQVDPSLIRYYFKERSSLLIAVAEQVTNEFATAMSKGTETAKTPEDLLALRVETLLDTNITNPYFHRLLVDELIPSKAPAARQLLQKINRRALEGYKSILAEGAKTGHLRQVEPSFLLLSIIGMCEFFLNGIPLLNMMTDNDLDENSLKDRYQAFVLDLLLNGLRPR